MKTFKAQSIRATSINEERVALLVETHDGHRDLLEIIVPRDQYIQLIRDTLDILSPRWPLTEGEATEQ